MNIEGIFKQFKKLDKQLDEYIANKEKKTEKIMRDKIKLSRLVLDVISRIEALAKHASFKADIENAKHLEDRAKAIKLQAKIKEII